MQKVEEISKRLEHTQFTASEGWYHRWKKRHGLTLVKLYGEASEANTEATVERTSNDMLESKDWLTILVCCSMNGDKHRLLVIGLSRNPRCFKNVQTFPANYIASKNAWMTTKIWTDRLQAWDKQLHHQKRKVALVVNNCAAHSDVKGLKCTKIVKLPPNTTSLIQPCDMGVIRTLKAHFRYEIRARIIGTIEDESGTNVSASVVEK